MTFEYNNFLTYHPYLTFSDPQNTCFVKPDGKRGEDATDDADMARLFFVGREAFGHPPETKSKDVFDGAYKAYFESIKNMRQMLQAANLEGRFVSVNSKKDKINVEWDNLENQQIIDGAWQLLSQLQPNEEIKGLFIELFLFHVFVEIDNAIVGYHLDGRGAIAGAIEATKALGNAMAIESGNEKLQEARQEMSYRGAMEKLARDPKQKEKAFILECWQAWQKSPNTYAYKAEFAKDMISKCEHLKSQKKVEDWCREWEKTHPAG
jgi:hypothetical protein